MAESESRFEYCRRRLRELKGKRTEVAQKAGLSYHTVNNFTRPDKGSGDANTVEKLYTALVAHFPEVSSPSSM